MKFLFYAFFVFVFLLESNDKYGETSNAFIFSLNNSEGLAPFLSKVKAESTGQAIRGNYFYGPYFGDDLIIYLNEGTIKFSKANLGPVYSVPASVNDKNTILKGPGDKFSPDEVEVFYLDPSCSIQDNTN